MSLEMKVDVGGTGIDRVTTLVFVYDEFDRRFVVKEIHNIERALRLKLRGAAEHMGFSPSQQILEANAKTRGGSLSAPWEWLAGYTQLPKRTQQVINRAFAELFERIVFHPRELSVDDGTLTDPKPIRLSFKNGPEFWMGDVRRITITTDRP